MPATGTRLPGPGSSRPNIGSRPATPGSFGCVIYVNCFGLVYGKVLHTVRFEANLDLCSSDATMTSTVLPNSNLSSPAAPSYSCVAQMIAICLLVNSAACIKSFTSRDAFFLIKKNKKKHRHGWRTTCIPRSHTYPVRRWRRLYEAARANQQAAYVWVLLY